MIQRPGKCPKCDASVDHIRLHALQASVGFRTQAYKAITFCCPRCDAILSAQLDPVALVNDIANAVSERVKGRV